MPHSRPFSQPEGNPIAHDIQGFFSVNGQPRNGATVKLWSSGAFASRPQKNTAIPSGSPLSSGTTGTGSGFDGGYRFESIASGEYYVSIEWNGGTSYDFHAVRDGTEGLGYTLSQDYASLDLAITATPTGGTLYIASGTYQLGTGLTVSKQINIKGVGNGTILRATGAIDILTVRNTSGVVLENLFFDGNSASAQGLVVSGAGQITVRDCTAKGCTNGFRLNNCNFVNGSANFASGCSNAGLFVSGSNNVTWEKAEWNQVSPANDVLCSGTWSVLRVDNAGRISAQGGSHLLITNFKHTSTSSLITSGTSDVFNPTSNRVYNVRDFGAKGDNSNDDTAAIQSAINTAKVVGSSALGTTVYFPAGQYKISSPVFLPRSGNTPNNVVHLRGENWRSTQFTGDNALFPAGSGMVMWDMTTSGRAWCQSISNLRFNLPAVDNTTAIYYLPVVFISGTPSASNILSEWAQIDLDHILCEGNNDYHRRHIWLRGNIKNCRIEYIVGDASLGNSETYDTIALEVDSDDYGTAFGGDDRSGLHYATIRGLWGGQRRGGRNAVFKGRLHRCTFETAHAFNGGRNDPAFNFINCSSCVVQNVINEGRGEKPQIYFNTCREMIIDLCSAASPDDAGMGVGHGIILSGCHDIQWNGHARTPGNASFASDSVYNLVLTGTCINCSFVNFNIVGHVSGEVNMNAASSGTCWGEFYDISGSVLYFVGTRALGQLRIDSSSYLKPLKWGTYFLWIDDTGDLRIHTAAPTAHDNGTVVGSQS